MNGKTNLPVAARKIHTAPWAFAFAFALASAFGGLSVPLMAKTFLSEDEALRLAFPAAASIELKRTAATNAQRERIGALTGIESPNRFFKYFEARSGGGVDGYAVVGDVLGKHQPITYMMAFGPDHTIRAIEILVYRESYGHEIRADRFRRQFLGKGIDDSLELNRDIRNIAGATISCRSILRAARENLAYLTVLVPREPAANPRRPATPAGAESAESAESAKAVGGRPVLRQRGRILMGTLLEISAYGADRGRLDAAIDAAFDEVARVESLLSTYREDSDVSRLNRNGHAAPVRVAPEVYDLLRRSVDLAQRTAGVFDVTVGPLVELWQDAEGARAVPDDEAIARALSSVGARHLVFLEDNQISMARPGVRVDLGGIGKGYAMDRAAAVLRRRGAERALLNFGGQILALDPPPSAASWPVWIRDPERDGGFLAAVGVVNQALSTSADDQRGLWIGGRRYSHIVDPTTGLPVNRALSATVLTHRAEAADAWSSALFAMDDTAAGRMAGDLRLSVLRIGRDGDLLATSEAFAIHRKGTPEGHRR